MKYLIFLLSFPTYAVTVTHIVLPTERENGDPVQCDIKEVRAYVDGDCVRFTSIDQEGRESFPPSAWACDGNSADLNYDGVVNAADLAIMKKQFFK